jgi:REP element-mobilizing transposase RayT
MTLLARTVDQRDLRGLVLCLMPNHYHFVVEGSREHLSQALHRVNGLYAETFNARYRRSGHLWGDRFALWQVRDEDHLVATCRYVLANPVRAGLCERPEDWEWSWSRYERKRAGATTSAGPRA